MSTLYWIVFLPVRPEKLYGNGTEVEQDVYRTGVSGRYWPRGIGALNPGGGGSVAEWSARRTRNPAVPG